MEYLSINKYRKNGDFRLEELMFYAQKEGFLVQQKLVHIGQYRQKRETKRCENKKRKVCYFCF